MSNIFLVFAVGFNQAMRRTPSSTGFILFPFGGETEASVTREIMLEIGRRLSLR